MREITFKALGLFIIHFRNYSALGTEATERAHQSHCRVQKQAATASAKLGSP